MGRTPRGYRGIDHETIGSDVLSLVNAVLVPAHIFGPDIMASLETVRATEWYPISRLLQPLERLDKVLGPSSLRKVGWSLFALSHEAAVKRDKPCARRLVDGFDEVYRRANRGIDIGGWTVLEQQPGKATMEKTTPHHCLMEEGILEAAFHCLDVPVVIYQTRCFRRGADSCHFVLTSHVTDHRWTGR